MTKSSVRLVGQKKFGHDHSKNILQKIHLFMYIPKSECENIYTFNLLLMSVKVHQKLSVMHYSQYIF